MAKSDPAPVDTNTLHLEGFRSTATGIRTAIRRSRSASLRAAWPAGIGDRSRGRIAQERSEPLRTLLDCPTRLVHERLQLVGRSGLVASDPVRITIERHRDRAVTDPAHDLAGIHSRSNHRARIGVAALVHRDRVERVRPSLDPDRPRAVGVGILDLLPAPSL